MAAGKSLNVFWTLQREQRRSGSSSEFDVDGTVHWGFSSSTCTLNSGFALVEAIAKGQMMNEYDICDTREWWCVILVAAGECLFTSRCNTNPVYYEASGGFIVCEIIPLASICAHILIWLLSTLYVMNALFIELHLRLLLLIF